MSETTIGACPVCGAQGEPATMDGYAHCCNGDCPMLPLPVADWNRLSRAAALLRAVEGLGDEPGDLCVSYEHRNRMTIVDRAWVYSLDVPPVNAGWKVYGGPSADPENGTEYGRFTAFAAALIALAGEVAK